MLEYIMFVAAVLCSLSMEMYGYQEACSSYTKVLSVVAIILTVIIAAAACVVYILIEKGVIIL